MSKHYSHKQSWLLLRRHRQLLSTRLCHFLNEWIDYKHDQVPKGREKERGRRRERGEGGRGRERKKRKGREGGRKREGGRGREW